ncbi:MAG: patatin-like phospholipase family protein [Desulfuromonadales bacterium]|nr:patatin-like phospholipase family protein [Desulfuromonadales bacterium]
MHTTSSRPKLGVALGSGAARGLAHIGVLKVLEEADIQIDIVTGTSMGAFIGAMYAAGVPVTQMERVALEIDWFSMARLLAPVMPTSGLSDGKKLVAFMAELLPVRDFKDLQLPLAVTATDINTGEAIIIKQGDLLEALHASLAFPGIFSPVRFGQRFLVDGGLCNPIPADVARSLGAEKIIGICTIPAVVKQTPETFMPTMHGGSRTINRWRDFFSTRRIEQAFRSALGHETEESLDGMLDTPKIPNIFRVCAQSVAIMENVINELQLRQNPHDLIIRPLLEGVTLLEFHRAKEVIAAGEAATRAALPQIRYMLNVT